MLEDNGIQTDCVFSKTTRNSANFIGKHVFESNRIILTDFCRLICESVYVSFLMSGHESGHLSGDHSVSFCYSAGGVTRDNQRRA